MWGGMEWPEWDSATSNLNRFKRGLSMAKKQFPKEQYMVWNTDEIDLPFLENHNTLEGAVDISVPMGDTVEIAVYKLDRVIKVKKESGYKIVK